MIKQYSIFAALPLSFFSRSLYQDIAQRWKGIGFIYVLLLGVLTALPYGYLWKNKVTYTVNVSIPPLVAQMPNLTLKNGILSTEKAQPYFIQDPKTKKIWAVIDTTDQYQSFDHFKQAEFLLTKKALLQNQKPTSSVTPYPQFEETTYITQETINGILQDLKKYIVPACFSLAILTFLFLRISQVLLTFIIGLIIVNTKKIPLSTASIFRLSAVAITPVAFLGAILELLTLNLPYQGLFKFILGIWYIYFAIKANMHVVKTGKET